MILKLVIAVIMSTMLITVLTSNNSGNAQYTFSFSIPRDNTPKGQPVVNQPVDLAVDANGNIYILSVCLPGDVQSVTKISPNGSI